MASKAYLVEVVSQKDDKTFAQFFWFVAELNVRSLKGYETSHEALTDGRLFCRELLK